MPALRLKPPMLSVARSLTAVPPLRRLAFQLAAGDFGLAELDRLPAEAKVSLDHTVAPRQGRPPHRWHDAELGPPTSARPTCATFTDAYRSGTSSPGAVLTAFKSLLEGRSLGEAHFSPLISVDLERAADDAAASALRWREGHPRGLLDGVPVVVKDCVDVAGLPTWGGTCYRAAAASRDAVVVQRLRAAGALVVGKTHATEWGLNPWGANAHRDLPRNVRSRHHGAGGSSTGTGVAVALGWVPVGLGGDGGGSIRIPAALNGIFGLKPTVRRLSRTGDTWGIGSSMDATGPLGGSAADLAAFLSVAAAVDPLDPDTLLAPDGHDAAPWRAALGRGVEGCRIGVPDGAWRDADPAVAARAEDALQALERAGAIRVPVSLPLESVTSAVGALVIASETLANLADDITAHGPSYGDELTVVLRLLQDLPAQRLLDAQRVRAALKRQVAACFAEEVDLLALPTTATPAPPYALSEAGHDILDTGATAAMTRYAFLANLTGLPAGTLPAGLVDGLAVGIQFVGDAWDEASVLAALAHGERLGVSDLPAPPAFVDLLELAG